MAILHPPIDAVLYAPRLPLVPVIRYQERIAWSSEMISVIQ